MISFKVENHIEFKNTNQNFIVHLWDANKDGNVVKPIKIIKTTSLDEANEAINSIYEVFRQRAESVAESLWKTNIYIELMYHYRYIETVDGLLIADKRNLGNEDFNKILRNLMRQKGFAN